MNYIGNWLSIDVAVRIRSHVTTTAGNVKITRVCFILDGHMLEMLVMSRKTTRDHTR